jgi:hypothetical protein
MVYIIKLIVFFVYGANYDDSKRTALTFQACATTQDNQNWLPFAVCFGITHAAFVPSH